jgi:hypothetical protein
MVNESSEMKGIFTTFEIVKVSSKVRLPDLVTNLNYQFIKFILFQKNKFILFGQRKMHSRNCKFNFTTLIVTHARTHTHTHHLDTEQSFQSTCNQNRTAT